MVDISSVNALSQGGNQFWLFVMDDIQTIVGVSSFIIRMSYLTLCCNGYNRSPPNIKLKLNALGVIMLVRIKVSNHY
jgi:hypothetical protein